MARLAVLGLLSLALLVAELAAQQGSGLEATIADDSDYGYTDLFSGSGDWSDGWEPPYISDDRNWTEHICDRYPAGAL